MCTRTDYAIIPGKTLKDEMKAVGMTVSELTRKTGYSRNAIYKIVRGRSPITAEIALSLEMVLGVSANFWNNLERNYREDIGHISEGKKR